VNIDGKFLTLVMVYSKFANRKRKKPFAKRAKNNIT